MRRRILQRAAALAFTLGALTTVGATAAQAAPAGSTYQGCPYGAVCIYPNASWNNGNPEHVYWSYGAHNLTDEYGVHRLFNNQSGGATARTCTGFNGTGCQGYLQAFSYIDKNLTPINSITLQP